MPPIVLAAGIAAAGAVGGAAISSRSASGAARRQSEATTEAARLEDEAAKRAEAFQRQQAQQQWVEAEAVRLANYDQWAARQRSLNAFRQKHGYGPTEIPGYVPSQDPGFGGGPPTDASLPAGPSASMVPPKMRDPNLPTPMGAVDAYLPSQGTSFQSYGGDQGPSVQPMRGGPAKTGDSFPGVDAGLMPDGGSSGGKPQWMDEDTWRRLESARQGYGWGGRRPGQPRPQIVPRAVGAVGTYLR